jgi:hypothetical protein
MKEPKLQDQISLSAVKKQNRLDICYFCTDNNSILDCNICTNLP